MNLGTASRSPLNEASKASKRRFSSSGRGWGSRLRFGAGAAPPRGLLPPRPRSCSAMSFCTSASSSGLCLLFSACGLLHLSLFPGEEGPREASQGQGARPGYNSLAQNSFLCNPILQKGLALDVTAHFSELVIKALEQPICNREEGECRQLASARRAPGRDTVTSSHAEGRRGGREGKGDRGPTGTRPPSLPAHALPLGHLMGISNGTDLPDHVISPEPRPLPGLFPHPVSSISLHSRSLSC